jgi:hypothetical protein
MGETAALAMVVRRTVIAMIVTLLLAATGAALIAHAAERSPGADDDPLATLGALVPSRNWGLAFWVGERKAATPLWRRALARCATAHKGALPNCTTVKLATWWGPAVPPAPMEMLAEPPIATPFAAAGGKPAGPAAAGAAPPGGAAPDDADRAAHRGGGHR